MKAVLVLNGETPDPARLKFLSSKYRVYAADGGAAVCLVAGVRPEWVAGDFDSIDPAELPEDWKKLYIPEQNRTDFQKLLCSLPEEIGELRILGGLGRRLDHLLTNLLIATEVSSAIQLVFETEGQVLHRVTSDCPFQKALPIGSSLSLLPLARVTGVRTEGLKWNLHGGNMGPGIQLGQSNRVEGPVVIRIVRGCLFVWTESNGDSSE